MAKIQATRNSARSIGGHTARRFDLWGRDQSTMFRNPFEGKNLPEVTVAETVAAKASGSHQIVDVREQEEWDAFRIADSIFIPLSQLPQRAGELDPTKPIITYCKSGVRSLYAVEMLQAAGRKNASSLTGGIIAWYEAGQPIDQ